jgi:Glycosyltransferase family 87
MPPDFQVKQQWLAALLALLAAGTMWFYVMSISVRHQQIEGNRRGSPRGNLSDLYPRWLGARELLLRGRDPYSNEITSEIQRGYYGREIDPSRPNDPKDRVGFAYPVYVVFILAPTVHMDFRAVRLLAMWVLAGSTVLSVLVWQWVMGVRFSVPSSLTWTLLTLGCYPFVEGLAIQQFSLLVAALFSGSFAMRKKGQLFASGVLLAIATIKPQIVLLPVILMLIWVSGNWRERQRWLWGFASTLILLLAGSEYLLPGWMFRFYNALLAYSQYVGGTSFLDLLLTSRLAGIGRAAMVLAALWAFWRARKFEADTIAAKTALSLAITAAVCTTPNLGTYNQVLLLPSLLLVYCCVTVPRASGLVVRQLKGITSGLLLWPWFLSGLLVIAAVVFHAEAFVHSAWRLPLLATLPLPLVVFALLLSLSSNSVGGGLIPAREMS